jgi:hypothetical protein
MSDIGHALHKETAAAKALRANLADIMELDEETAELAVASETNLNEAIDAAVKLLVDDVAAMKGLNAMIDLLSARKDRLEARIKNYRTALAVALEQAGRKKVEHPAVTLSMRAVAPSVTIIDEALIPAKFFVAGEPKLSKKAVGDALKAKEDVPGAVLSNGSVSLALIWS